MLILSSIVKPLPPKRNNNHKNKKHLMNVHKSFQNTIKLDMEYIEKNCNSEDNDVDTECILRWERISSVSTLAKDVLKKLSTL